MWKKFLAVMAIIGLFTTTTASALEVGGEPGGGGNGVPNVIDNFTVSPATFNPGANETASVSYTLAQAADIYAYAVNDNFDVFEIVGSAVAPQATAAGNVTHTWNGKNAAGNVVADGTYTVKIFAYDGNSIVDFDHGQVTVTSVPPVDPNVPTISALKVDPLTFSAETDETTEISFDVNKDAFVSVVINESAKAGQPVVRNFTNYDGNDFYQDSAVHSISWNGTDNSGNVVADGNYTVKVTAQNDAGSATETTTVTVKTEGPISKGVIEDFQLNPSSVWDPTEDVLEIEFELNDDVNSLTIDAKRGNKVIEIIDDEFADDDDYEEQWDGTDDDGDYVEEGDWEIIVRADGDKVSKVIKVQYEQPDITEAFVTKTSIDPSEDEFANLVFKVDAASEVTVEVYKGSKRKATLWDEVDVQKNKWYAVEWDAMDDGSEVDDGTDWKFKITAENPVDNNVEDVKTVEIDVEEDDVSDKKSNVTNDYTNPVIFDEDEDDSITVNYCIEGDADVFLAVYEGNSTTGKAEIELLDYVYQDAGCHTASWNGRDKNNKDLKDGIYSYKLISRASGNHKDTEVGRFVVGEAGVKGGKPTPPKPEPPKPEPPKPPVTDPSPCGGYWDAGYLKTADWETCDAIEWVTEEDIFHGYADGSFGPINKITRAEVLKVVLKSFDNAVILPMDGSDAGFNDVNPTAWYMPYVRTAKFYGMLHGYPDGGAKLWYNINRVEFLKFVLEAAEQFSGYYVPSYNYSYYADVNVTDPVQSWFINYAGAAYDYMLYNEKYEGGQYYLEPAKAVTRGEVALLLYRMNNNGLLDGSFGYYEVPVFEESDALYFY